MIKVILGEYRYRFKIMPIHGAVVLCSRKKLPSERPCETCGRMTTNKRYCCRHCGAAIAAGQATRKKMRRKR